MDKKYQSSIKNSIDDASKIHYSNFMLEYRISTQVYVTLLHCSHTRMCKFTCKSSV